VSSRRVELENADAPAAINRSSTHFDVVVIGASAGGLSALGAVLGELPAAFPVPLVLVLHLSPDRPSHLTDVLGRQTRLRVRWAQSGQRLEPGTIYVAPPNRHVVFDPDGAMSLLQTPAVHFSRPSVDLLFESAARTFGSRTLAVILTGNGYDGSDGVPLVHRFGGVVIAQDEASSQFFSMPREAIESGGVSYVLPLDAIAPAILRLVALGIQGGASGVATG
jgi:two-component system, chemotaxis family, protein-glutamate methylesterase/glutaminase